MTQTADAKLVASYHWGFENRHPVLTILASKELTKAYNLGREDYRNLEPPKEDYEIMEATS